MRTCFLVTPDPFLVRLTELGEVSAKAGLRVVTRTRVAFESADEEDILVIDARGEARRMLEPILHDPRLRRRYRVVVIMDEAASTEQRAVFIDAGVASAVPANPARLGELLAQAIRDVLEETWP